MNYEPFALSLSKGSPVRPRLRQAQPERKMNTSPGRYYSEMGLRLSVDIVDQAGPELMVLRSKAAEPKAIRKSNPKLVIAALSRNP